MSIRIGKPNRHTSTKPKKGFHWCFNCDRQIVHNGQKCTTCKKKDKSKRRKKGDWRELEYPAGLEPVVSQFESGVAYQNHA